MRRARPPTSTARQIYRKLGGVHLISCTWIAAFGPDLTGQTKRLRDGHGIGMTAAWNQKLANYVETVLKT